MTLVIGISVNLKTECFISTASALSRCIKNFKLSFYKLKNLMKQLMEILERVNILIFFLYDKVLSAHCYYERNLCFLDVWFIYQHRDY